MVLFDRICWKDPISSKVMEPVISARTPAGVPICGALRISDSGSGYPITDCVARLTPELAVKHEQWLNLMELTPPLAEKTWQAVDTVESFGWQWAWNSEMRSEQDLLFRVVERFGLNPEFFRNKLVLDAGAGAGDQSRYMLELGASVVSLDLSSAIDITAFKLRINPEWVGIQGDITNLPFENAQFDIVYCEGVLQHTLDTELSLRELCRQLNPGGYLLATHYVRPEASSQARKMIRKCSTRYYEFLRSRISRLERFKILFLTGLLAALNYVPLIGYLLRRSGMVKYYNLMPDFKTTWTNTYDFFGSHKYQRIISSQSYLAYFDNLEEVEPIFHKPGVILARKK